MDFPPLGLCWRIYEPLDLVICWGQGCAVGRTGLQRRSTMTMWPRSGHAVPAGTAQVARAAFPKGCLAIRIRDALGALFEDAQFTELFAVRGRPAVSPARLALVPVLQFAEGLSDRQAADAVRARIDWKYALVRHEAPVRREALGTEGGASPPRWAVAAAW